MGRGHHGVERARDRTRLARTRTLRLARRRRLLAAAARRRAVAPRTRNSLQVARRAIARRAHRHRARGTSSEPGAARRCGRHFSRARPAAQQRGARVSCRAVTIRVARCDRRSRDLVRLRAVATRGRTRRLPQHQTKRRRDVFLGAPHGAPRRECAATDT